MNTDLHTLCIYKHLSQPASTPTPYLTFTQTRENRIIPKQTLILPQLHMRHHHAGNTISLAALKISMGLPVTVDRPLTKSTGGLAELAACAAIDGVLDWSLEDSEGMISMVDFLLVFRPNFISVGPAVCFALA